LITTDFVVDETLTLIRFRLGLRAAHTWWQQIDGSARPAGSASTVIISNVRARCSSIIATRICPSQIARASQ
jgi:hypothetical protein